MTKDDRIFLLNQVTRSGNLKEALDFLTDVIINTEDEEIAKYTELLRSLVIDKEEVIWGLSQKE